MPAKTPEECDALFEQHINAGELDALADLYEPDAVLIPAPGETATGRDAIRAALGAFIEAKPTLRLQVIKSFVAGPDVAVLYNDWHGKFAGPDGEMETGGEAIEIVRRQADGTWRFVFDDPIRAGVTRRRCRGGAGGVGALGCAWHSHGTPPATSAARVLLARSLERTHAARATPT